MILQFMTEIARLIPLAWSNAKARRLMSSFVYFKKSSSAPKKFVDGTCYVTGLEYGFNGRLNLRVTLVKSSEVYIASVNEVEKL